jgi:hypothetical protein
MVVKYCGTKYSLLIIIAGLAMIMNVEVSYFAGMLYALISILGVFYLNEW